MMIAGSVGDSRHSPRAKMAAAAAKAISAAAERPAGPVRLASPQQPGVVPDRAPVTDDFAPDARVHAEGPLPITVSRLGPAACSSTHPRVTCPRTLGLCKWITPQRRHADQRRDDVEICEPAQIIPVPAPSAFQALSPGGVS